jgi:hypothetical protein
LPIKATGYFDVKEDEWFAKDITAVNLKKFQGPTSGLPDFLVKIFRSKAAKEGLTESEADSFLKLLDSSKAKMPKINPMDYP